mmetsp:Transcript_12738/g.18762  ORF Transcript_12738/g.18762 Transcript_12738/m.18762 type:complete len:244 (-) Transcript_12738:188-919(-)
MKTTASAVLFLIAACASVVAVVNAKLGEDDARRTLITTTTTDEDCSAVSCFVPDCGGTTPLIEDCCPICDCDEIACIAKVCDEETETTYKNPGECCTQCEPTPTCDKCGSNGYFDGCNTCLCDDNGNPSCSKRSCETNTKPFCFEDETDEKDGVDVVVSCETCPSGSYFDGCNECTCDDGDGMIAMCTEIACAEEVVGEAKCHPTLEETVEDLVLRVDELFSRVEALANKLDSSNTSPAERIV